jgi:hypothetical protein
MKGDLKLLKLTNRVRDVLQITKLHTIIDIMDDESVAVESCGRAIAATGMTSILFICSRVVSRIYCPTLFC